MTAQHHPFQPVAFSHESNQPLPKLLVAAAACAALRILLYLMNFVVYAPWNLTLLNILASFLSPGLFITFIILYGKKKPLVYLIPIGLYAFGPLLTVFAIYRYGLVNGRVLLSLLPPVAIAVLYYLTMTGKLKSKVPLQAVAGSFFFVTLPGIFTNMSMSAANGIVTIGTALFSAFLQALTQFLHLASIILITVELDPVSSGVFASSRYSQVVATKAQALPEAPTPEYEPYGSESDPAPGNRTLISAPTAPVALENIRCADGGFFSRSEYIIDEKLSVFRFTNAYKIYDASGSHIGWVEQQSISGGAKAARLLLGSKVKGMQAFRLNIMDLEGKTLVSVAREGAGSGMSGIRTISLSDGAGQSLGALKFARGSWTPKLDIFNRNGEVVGHIAGDWKGWNFTITDACGTTVGAVNKKWAGLMTEVFTTKDKYRVSISSQASGLYRTAIVAAAITLDMVFHEV